MEVAVFTSLQGEPFVDGSPGLDHFEVETEPAEFFVFSLVLVEEFYSETLAVGLVDDRFEIFIPDGIQIVVYCSGLHKLRAN